MSASTFSAAAMRQADDYCLPYRVKRGKNGDPDMVEEMPFYDNAVMGPAGSIHSSLNDLILWLKVHLNDGRSGDTQFISAGNLAQMHQPQMIMPVSGINKQLFDSTIQAYGMGWFIQPYRGHTLIEHGGNIDGFSVNIAFVPQEKIGVIALTNIDGKPLRDVLRYEVIDRLLGVADHEWDKKYHAIWSAIDQGTDQSVEVSNDERVPDTTPSHPLSDYVGIYEADGYAPLEIKLENEVLFGWLAGEWWKITHYHYDIFDMNMERFETHLKLTFSVDAKGNTNTISLPLEPAVAELIFKRKALGISLEAAQQLVGEYALPFEGMIITISKKADGRLFSQLTGQSEAELIPYRKAGDDLEFALKDQANITIAFTHGNQADGTYTVALIKQVGAVFKATRLPL
jgi:hypothetical protein